MKILSNPKFLRIARSSVLQVAQLAGFADDACQSLVTAVDEAMSNIIRYAYQMRTDQPITLQCIIESDHLKFILRDFGTQADPESLKGRDLDDIRPGGLGIHFIKSIMDSVEYDTSHDIGTELTMIKYLPGKK